MRWQQLMAIAWSSQEGQETWTGLKEKGSHLILHRRDFTSTSQRDQLIWTAHIQFCVFSNCWENTFMGKILSFFMDYQPELIPRVVEFLKSCNSHLFQKALLLTNIASWASENTYAILKEGITLPLIEILCGPSLIYPVIPEFRHHHLKQCYPSPACCRIFNYTVTMCLWQGSFWLV